MALAPLSDRPGYEFAEGAYDVRGWSVVTLVDDERVGEVHDLLVDDGGEPRYLDVDLGLFRKHALLPIGHARADRSRRIVWVPGFTKEQFHEIPAYPHDLTTLTREYESGLVAAYSSAYSGAHYRRHDRPAFGGTVYGPTELEDRIRAEPAGRLVPLSRHDELRVAGDAPDPRGWPLLLEGGERVGAVEDLLVDTAVMKVRFLVCDLEPAARPPGVGDHRVLVPVELARLDESGGAVRVAAASVGELTRLEAQEHAPGGADFYRQPRFDAREFFGRGTG